MLFERVKFLSDKKGKNLKEVALDLGLSENAFYKWKTQSPKVENVKLVADYFDVSTDYLLGLTDDISPKKADQDDFTQFFKINTYGMSPEDKEMLEKELKQFMDYRTKVMRGEL